MAAQRFRWRSVRDYCSLTKEVVCFQVARRQLLIGKDRFLGIMVYRIFSYGQGSIYPMAGDVDWARRRAAIHMEDTPPASRDIQVREMSVGIGPVSARTSPPPSDRVLRHQMSSTAIGGALRRAWTVRCGRSARSGRCTFPSRRLSSTPVRRPGCVPATCLVAGRWAERAGLEL